MTSLTLYYERQKKGLCADCGNAKDSDLIRCSTCLKRLRVYRANSRKKKRQLLQCRDCTNPLDYGKRLYCSSCSKKRCNKIKTRQRKRYKTEGRCSRCGHKRKIGQYCEKHWFKAMSRRHLKTMTKDKDLMYLLVRQDYKCPYSGRNLIPGVNASIDHINPTSNGGTDDLSNIQWVDYQVNIAKHQLSESDFLLLIKDIYNHTTGTKNFTYNN